MALAAVPLGDNRTTSPVETVRTGHEPVRTERPFYKAWWFWTAVGVVVAGGVTSMILLTGGNNRVASGMDGTFDASTFPAR